MVTLAGIKDVEYDERDDAFVSVEHEEDSEPMLRLTRDLRKAARTLDVNEARYLVDAYYTQQNNRIRANNQAKIMGKTGEPHDVVSWLTEQNRTLENQIKSALNIFVREHKLGEWAMSISGIGPVLAAGLMAHIDVSKATSASSVWRFAGLDPTSEWNKGEKRPWNAKLKVICWKIGESFVKVRNRDSDIYGKIYYQRKSLEWANNARGNLKDVALQASERVGKDTDAYVWYSGQVHKNALREYQAKSGQQIKEILTKLEEGTGTPMLAPGHIEARAKRYATKRFLSHYYHVAHLLEYGIAPAPPYGVTLHGHSHFDPPPHLDVIE